MKKVTIAVLVMAFFMLTLATVPALAMNSKWIPVVITRTGNVFEAGDRWFTEGDTYHLRDMDVGVTSYSIVGTGVSYAGSSSSTLMGNLNLKTGEGKSIAPSIIVLPGGTFEGIYQFTGTFVVVPENYSNVNLRGYMIPVNAIFRAQWEGTGDYQGQKLLLEYEIVNRVAPSPLVGYLFIP